MGCETGDCPSCIIKVGATPTPINLRQYTRITSHILPPPYNLASRFIGSDYVQPYHLFIVYYDVNQTIVYRGGPDAGNKNKYNDLVAEGLAQVYQAPRSENYDIPAPFDNLITNRMVGLARDFDYNAWIDNGEQPRHMVTIAEGADYCGLDEAFTRETRRIGELGRTYNAIHLDRTDNSNATVFTILQEMGLPLIKPNVHAPGWGTNLHTAPKYIEEAAEAIQGAGEAIGQPFRDIQQEMNRFDRLSPIQQYEYMRRMFGMR